MVGGEVIETPSAAYKTAVINQYTNRPLKIHSKIKSFYHLKDDIIISKIFIWVNDISEIFLALSMRLELILSVWKTEFLPIEDESL